jgi:hypothetical protein
MSLRFRSTSTTEEKPNGARDPKAPHLFQEAVPGGPCAVCARSKTDPRHLTVEENESPRWGF